MPRIEIYTREWCPACLKTVAYFIQNSLPFRELSLTHAPDLAGELRRRVGHDHVPLVFVDGEPIGGHAELVALHQRGGLKGGEAAAVERQRRPMLKLSRPSNRSSTSPGR